MATQKSIAFHTLGCKLNYSETSSIKHMFEERGYAVLNDRQAADIFVLNTCSVTDFADRKCRKEIRRFKRQNPDSKVIVIGCYAQLKPKEIAEIQGVNLVLGAAEKFQILDFVPELYDQDISNTYFSQPIEETRTFFHAHSEKDRTRSFLKVQDGCDYKCSFCTIPLARGKSRSDSVKNVLREAQRLAEAGTREIVLTGVNIGDFGHGQSLDEKDPRDRQENFFDLVHALDAHCEVPRIRISSIEPNLLSDEIIAFVAQSERFTPHFHMPLQSGSDTLLKKMRRRYNTALYSDRVRKIKSLMPHACIGVDVIVGFPGETDDIFQETFDYLNGLDISYLHVFTYSERENTPAAEMGDVVPMETRRARNEALRRLSDVKKTAFYRQHLGEARQVLFEKSREARRLTGFTDNYIKINAPDELGSVNTLQKVQLRALAGDRVEVSGFE